MGGVDDRRAWLALGREEQRLRIESRTLAPGGEGGRRDQRVELQRELGAVLRREERVDLEDAELAERGSLDLADQGAEVEVAPGPPGVLDQVREQHVLAARQRIGGDPDEPEQARHRALDLVAERLRLGIPGERRRAQRAEHVERHAGGRPGRVDGDVGRVLQLLDLLGAGALRREPLAPGRRRLLGELLDGDSVGLRIGGVHPGLEARRRKVGEREREVAHVALRVDDQGRNAGQQRLLEQDDREPGLAGAGHADDDAVRRQVARADDEVVRARLARRGIDDLAEGERAAICHGAECMTT